MFWRQLFFVVLLGLNLILVYSLIWGQEGVLVYREMKEQSGGLEQKIATLAAANLAVSKEIRLLQSDTKYLEKMIRTRLNFVRNNEILYIFPNGTDSDTAGVLPNEGKN